MDKPNSLTVWSNVWRKNIKVKFLSKKLCHRFTDYYMLPCEEELSAQYMSNIHDGNFLF